MIIFLILFIQTTTFGLENVISIFIENAFYEEIEEIKKIVVEEIIVEPEEEELEEEPEDDKSKLEKYLRNANVDDFPEIEKFFTAIQIGNTYGVVEGLAKNIHPDTRSLSDVIHGVTPLIEAASYRRFLIIEMLLLSGADPNLSSYSLGVSNLTPLMIAAQRGPFEIVEALVNSGADVNAQTTGQVSGSTALMTAIKNQREDIVRFLLERGADLNLSTTSGEVTNVTPLMIAAQTGNFDIVKLLLSYHRLDIQAKDSIGRNVLVYAYMSGNIEIIQHLGSIGITTDLPPSELQKFMR